MKAIKNQDITFCDDQGRLSVELFTATAQGSQLKQILERGVLCEILTWQMDVEEPDAAATISLAENEVNQVGMRTTEIEAIKVLKGQVIIEMSKDVSERVCFQTVVDAVAMQLGPAVADPDLLEIFDYLISNGVGKNSYIDDLLDWASFYVNGKMAVAFCRLRTS